jgi:ABC-type hemin transport system substrate-binding protein
MTHRKLRRTLEIGFPAAGVLAIVAGALVATDEATRVGLTVIGIVLLLITSFDLDEMMLPNQRRLSGLRAEVNQFLRTVRRMNRAALAATHSKADLDRFQTASEELLERARVIADTAAATHGLRNESLAPTR